MEEEVDRGGHRILAARARVAEEIRLTSMERDAAIKAQRIAKIPLYRADPAILQALDAADGVPPTTLFVWVAKDRQKVGHKLDPTVAGPIRVKRVYRSAKDATSFLEKLTSSIDKSGMNVDVIIEDEPHVPIRSISRDHCP